MNTMAAFAMGQMNRGREQKVFDWDKAAELINYLNLTDVEAGLREDMENTSGTILSDGEPVFDSYTYLASTWATPIIVWNTGEAEDTCECYKMASETDWNAKTKWPESALAILKEKEKEG